MKVNLQLDSNLGGIDLVANPPGVTIYIDGVKKGVTEPGENPKFSKVFEVRGLRTGKHTVKMAHKRATPPEVRGP